MKKTILAITAVAMLAFAGQSNAQLLSKLRGKPAQDPSGSAAGASSQGSGTLEQCDEPLGTIGLVEEQEGDWFRYLTQDLRLPSTIPVIRMLVQQSNCFVVVERGRAMSNMMQERDLARSGEVRKGSKMGKGQMVAADFTLNPSINFSQDNAGGIGGAVGGLLSKFGAGGVVAGAIAGNMKFKKAQTMLTMIDNRSGVQIATAMGNSRKTDFGMGGIGFGGRGGAALGGYTNTAEGQVIVASFADAYNNMVRSLRNYKAQEVRGGLGKGGRLKVGN